MKGMRKYSRSSAVYLSPINHHIADKSDKLQDIIFLILFTKWTGNRACSDKAKF